MNKNLIFFILNAVLLIKISLGVHVNISRPYEWAPNEKPFRDAIVAKLVALSDGPLKLGKQLIENTYADKQENVDIARFLAEFLRDFQNIEPEKPESKIKLFLRLGLVVDTLSGPINDKTMNKEMIDVIKYAIEKHDVTSVANEFLRKFDEFLEWLTLESDKLNSEERLGVNEFKEVFLQYKEETNPAKKEKALKDLIYRVEL